MASGFRFFIFGWNKKSKNPGNPGDRNRALIISNPEFYTRHFKTSLPHKYHSFSPPNILHFHTKPSVPHKSVSSTQIRLLHTQFLFGYFARKWRVELTNLFGKGGFMWNRRIRVELMAWCRSDGYWGWKGVVVVWKWRICVDITDKSHLWTKDISRLCFTLFHSCWYDFFS